MKTDIQIVQEKLFGECWHEPVEIGNINEVGLGEQYEPELLYECLKCKKRGSLGHLENPNPTLDGNYILKCKNKLEENEKWVYFRQEYLNKKFGTLAVDVATDPTLFISTLREFLESEER